jgi:ATP-dependent DNA helicase RecG
MAIEGAERFGLAQLHQLRGRVGRSSRPSYCLLLTDNPSPRSLERLGALTKFMSGFELAETDLAQRGPGDILGEAQSGFLKLRFAELADAELLKLVREIGSTIIQTDPELKKWPKLAHLVKQTDFHPE